MRGLLILFLFFFMGLTQEKLHGVQDMNQGVHIEDLPIEGKAYIASVIAQCISSLEECLYNVERIGEWRKLDASIEGTARELREDIRRLQYSLREEESLRNARYEAGEY